LGGFPSESAQVGFGGTFGYVWQSLIVLVLVRNQWVSAIGVGDLVGFAVFLLVASLFDTLGIAIAAAVLAGMTALAVMVLARGFL
jgi:hypothetical protein